MSWPYDYIIIGAGSAGCAIANRLAEDIALRILIIEAGPPAPPLLLLNPPGVARQLGNEGWSYREVLPFFKKAERNERYTDEYHGTEGPLNVAEQRHALEINDGFIRAAAGLGIPRNDDFNGADQFGVGYYQVTQREQ